MCILYGFYKINNDIYLKVRLYDNDASSILKTKENEKEKILCVLYETKEKEIKLLILQNDVYFGKSIPPSNSEIYVYQHTHEYSLYIIYGKTSLNTGYYEYYTKAGRLTGNIDDGLVLDIYIIQDTTSVLGNGKCYDLQGNYMFDF